MAIARVALPVAAWHSFDYWIPDGLQVACGDVVRVRLAGRAQRGVVTGIEPASDFVDRVQPIESIAGVARLPAEIIELASFVAAYYQSPPGMAFALVTPPLVRARAAAKPPAVTGAQSDAEFVADIRARSYSVFHPCGSCGMGPDPTRAVVDHRLKVHGLEGLRVVDASIFPSVTSGNINAPSIMVGEKGADLVLAG